eukprot:g3021.t2
MQFFPCFAAIPTCTLISTVLTDWVASPLGLSPLNRQILLLMQVVILANISALTINRLMDSFPQLMGFFACVLSACMLCPWNFLFGAFTAVWIGVAVGSILEEVILRRTLQREIKRREATGEDDMAFFDQKRAASMEEWQELEDDEEPSLPPPEPDRADKLQAYLELAAAGERSGEMSGLEPREEENENRFALENWESNVASSSEGDGSRSRSDEGSVEVDALEDELDEDEEELPELRPLDARSLELMKSRSFPSSSELVDPPDLLDVQESEASNSKDRPPSEDEREGDDVELPEDAGDADLRAAAAAALAAAPVPSVPEPAREEPEEEEEAEERSNEEQRLEVRSPTAASESAEAAIVPAEQARRAHLEAAESKPAAQVNPMLKSLSPKRQDLWSRVHGARQPRAVPSLRPAPNSQRGPKSSRTAG